MADMTALKHLAHHADDETYYSPQELAVLWGCNKATVYSLLRSGKLGGFKIGRDWRISASDRAAYEQDPDNRTMKRYKPRARRPTAMRVV